MKTTTLKITDVLIRSDLNVRVDEGDSLSADIVQHGIRVPIQGYTANVRLPEGPTILCHVALEGGGRRLPSLMRALGYTQEKFVDVHPDGEKIEYLRFIPDPSGTPMLDAEDQPLTVDHPHAEVPFIIRDEWRNDAIERTCAVLNFGVGSKPLTMAEKASGFSRLRSQGLDMEQIARRCNCTATHVRDCLDLIDFVDPEILEHVCRGRCSASMAIELSKACMVNGVSDRTQQVIYFRQGMERAIEQGGEDARVTAKHLPIAIGKAAKKPEVPFADVDVNESGVDHEGRIHNGEEETLPLSESTKVTATVILATRNDVWHYGYILKWPGLNKDDGWLKVLPSLKGTSDPDRRRARLYALGALHAELGAKDFAEGRGDRALALSELESIQLKAAAEFPSFHQPQPQQQGDSQLPESNDGDKDPEPDPENGQESEQDSQPPQQDGQPPMPDEQPPMPDEQPPKPDEQPIPSISVIIKEILRLRDSYLLAIDKVGTPMVFFDRCIEHLRTAAEAPRSNSHELLDSILAATSEQDSEPERYSTLVVVAEVLSGRVGDPSKSRQNIAKWLKGIFTTTEEFKAEA
jgi:hypothetical protein